MRKAELPTDISVEMDNPKFQRLLVQDIELHICNARNLTYQSKLPQLKNLSAAVKDLIDNAKYLDTLTLGFLEKMPVFPFHFLVDLAPHAQHIHTLHSKSRYGGDRSDVVAAYEIFLPFLEAFPDLTHLAFTGVSRGLEFSKLTFFTRV
ncbi:hypothetical protein BG000_001058 [Podila horticola]|nr:hypothetical protein BG000_001058 [Podila horticola]